MHCLTLRHHVRKNHLGVWHESRHLGDTLGPQLHQRNDHHARKDQSGLGYGFVLHNCRVTRSRLSGHQTVGLARSDEDKGANLQCP